TRPGDRRPARLDTLHLPPTRPGSVQEEPQVAADLQKATAGALRRAAEPLLLHHVKRVDKPFDANQIEVAFEERLVLPGVELPRHIARRRVHQTTTWASDVAVWPLVVEAREAQVETLLRLAAQWTGHVLHGQRGPDPGQLSDGSGQCGLRRSGPRE